MLGDAGQRLVSNWDHPFETYIQEQNTYFQTGEVFSVPCAGIPNMDISVYREDWECEELSDEEVIRKCCQNSYMADEIEALAKNIYENANGEKY